MPSSNYSFLDLTVMPFARRKVVSSDAAILFDNDFKSILWANAMGTELFASGQVIDLLESDISGSHPVVSQFKNAASQLVDQTPVVRSFKITQGLKTLTLKGSIQLELLPDGDSVYLVIVPNWNEGNRQPEHELAELAVNSLDGFADASAIVDEFGLPVASSSEFDRMDVSPATLTNLVDETADEADRMVKRKISNEAGAPLAAGIGRIQDVPSRYIVVLAEFADEESTSPADDDDIADTLPHGIAENEHVVAPPWEIETPADALHNEQNLSAEDTDPNDIESQDASLMDRWYFKDDAGNEHHKDDLEADTAKRDNGSSASSTEEVVSTSEADASESDGEASGEKPIRFAFSIGSDQVFKTVSPELKEIVGHRSADIVGKHWANLANAYGFDESGSILKLLEKADTWSGKSVLWPVENTDMLMPVDLAALPIFDKERNFDGFRGFGIIRTADAVVDTDAKGMHLDDLLAGSTNDHVADDWPDEKTSAPRNNVSSEVSNEELDEQDNSHHLGIISNDGLDIETNNETNIVRLHSNRNSEPETAKTISPKDAKALTNIREHLERQGVKVSERSDAEEGDGSASEASIQLEQLEPPDQKRDSLRQILAKFDAPILVYNSDETLFANQELLELAGYDSLEQLSEHGGIDQLLGEDDLDAKNSTLQLKRKDGTLISVEPILKKVEWNGTNALCLTFEKATDKAPSIETVPNSERSALDMVRVSDLESILDTATDGILILQSDGTVEALNASGEALFAKSQADLIGKDFTKLFAKESKSTLVSYFADMNNPDKSVLVNEGREVIGEEANGGMIPMFVNIGSIGNAGKFCMVMRDLTERKKGEEELVTAKRSAEAASEQKSEFLARISHEIREPLNAIIGFSDIMIEERFGPVENERYGEYLRDINRSGVHVLDLVNDLLDISKIEAGKLDLSYEAIDLNQLAAETVALLQPKANNRRIIIRTSLSRAVPKVVADARSIRQIIMNLASNAIHHSPPNSQVIVSTTFEANGEVGLRIRDTGNGMSKQQLEVALEPFSQLKEKDVSTNAGTGLGLPLTKALVEANRAFFELESAKGVGTIAYVQFPSQRVLSE